MKIKRLVVTLILIPTFIYCSITCFAHSGRTDAYGGHYGDGGYHYHHGYTAHQHPNGTCPYNFDDQTDHSNNGGTSSWPRIEKDKDDSSSSSVEKEENEISEYIEKHYGVFDNVLHEIASPDIHLDIAMIPASEDRNYITLCTIGAGAYRMHIDKKIRIGYGLIERAEYVLFLPSDWKLDNESLKDEKYYWPFRVLKDAARLPVRTESWLGYGHTISPTEGDLLTESMPYDSVLLTYPVPEFGTKQYADLSSGKSVNFFQVHPLTPDELEYKAESSTPELLERIYPEEDDAMEIYLNRMKLQEEAINL